MLAKLLKAGGGGGGSDAYFCRAEQNRRYHRALADIATAAKRTETMAETVRRGPKPPDPVMPAKVAAPTATSSRKKDKDLPPSPFTHVWSEEVRGWMLVRRPKYQVAGPFYAYEPLPASHVDLLRQLLSDPSTPLCEEFYLRELVPRLNRVHQVSLRMLDWLMVDYSREFMVTYAYKVRGALETVDVHKKYARLLKCWRRRRFDCFRRRDRVYVDLEGTTYATTVAQLHFFYVAHLYGFLEYTSLHLEEVDAHMKRTFARAAAKRKPAAAAPPAKRRRQALVRKTLGVVAVSAHPHQLCMAYPDVNSSSSSAQPPTNLSP